MILGLDIIKKLVENQKLVENLSEKEIKNPENAGFDFRIGELYELEGEGFIGIEERKTPDSKLIIKYKEGKNNKIVIKPGDYLLAKTIERVNIPNNVFAIYFTRSTTWRCGIKLVSGMLGPGYKGEVIFPIFNAGKNNITIELGAKMIHVFFNEIEGETKSYKGAWQGGKIT